MPSPDQVAFQFSGQDVSLNQVLMLPVALLRGYFALNFLVLLVLRRMTPTRHEPRFGSGDSAIAQYCRSFNDYLDCVTNSKGAFNSVLFISGTAAQPGWTLQGRALLVRGAW